MSETTGIIISNTPAAEMITPSVGKTTICPDENGIFSAKNSDGVVTPIATVRTVKRTFTAAEILAFHTTKINLVEALGANVLSDVSRITWWYKYADAEYAGSARLYVGENYIDTHNLGGANDYVNSTNFTEDGLASNYVNKAISIGASSAITGETANGTLTVVLTYTIIDLS